MAKPGSVLRAEDYDEALAALVHRRTTRAHLVGHLAAVKADLAARERELVELDKDIAARAAALKGAHAKGDFFAWAGAPTA